MNNTSLILMHLIRAVVAIAIWGGFTVTAIMLAISPTSNISGSNAAFIIAILAAAATVSTLAVFRSSSSITPAAASAAQAETEKAKRLGTSKDRLSRMLGALDDDEAAAMLEDLKSRLAGGDSDGELSAVEMLREERRQRR